MTSASGTGHEHKPDPCTLSNYRTVVVRSLAVNLRVEFSSKTIQGIATYTIQVLNPTTEIVLDTSALTIISVWQGDSSEPRKALTFTLADPKPPFGRALRIQLEAEAAVETSLVLSIEYTVLPESTAVQWLEPAQTAEKTHPYLFTQCQAIHARSLYPCQDTPGVKFTYEASVTVPKPLTALMSALSRDAPVHTGTPDYSAETLTYTFQQPVPVPSYLLALAVGKLESRDIGPRSKVWSEPSMVEAGAYEFAQTEEFIAVGEKLLGPYVWGRYDILLLPPSFPYGGMENPCLTFVTPTLLAGDRSLANVVAHEIAHSWMGNLVTNDSWEDFWLNEGHTVYVERKICEAVYGKLDFDLHAAIGYGDLKKEVDNLGPTNPFTALVPNLDDVDPDDAFSSIPYEKGFLLLHFIRSQVGDAFFDSFLHAYVEKFKFKTVRSEDWEKFVLSFFPQLPSVDWDTWFHAVGMPPYVPHYDTSLITAAKSLAARWCAGVPQHAPEEFTSLSPAQKVIFLDTLLEHETGLSLDALVEMDKVYSMSTQRNTEIRFRWTLLCIELNHEPIADHAIDFLLSQGRMKFIRPLYRALYKVEWGREKAVSTFKAKGSMYHGIAQKMVAKDLELTSS